MSEVSKQLSGVMLELYKDSLQLSVRIWGKFLGDLASRRVRALRKNLLRADDKLQQEAPENIVSPKFDVAMPILEKMRYTEEEALTEAYAELLKNSCLKDRQAKVLPAYSQILSSLSPDEVKILDFLYSGKNCYEISGEELEEVMSEEERSELKHYLNSTGHKIVRAPHQIVGLPFIEVRIQNPGLLSQNAAKYFSDIDEKISLSNPENAGAYIENLKAAGLFTVRENVCFTPASIYSDLEKSAMDYKEALEMQGCVTEMVKGQIRLTSLAQSFLAMCTSNRHNEESNAPPA